MNFPIIEKFTPSRISSFRKVLLNFFVLVVPFIILAAWVMLTWGYGSHDGYLAQAATGDINHQINYQGKLADSDGHAINGNYNFSFDLYATPTGGSSLWHEEFSALTPPGQVHISSGIFSVALGTSSTIPTNIFFNDSIYLEVKFDSNGDGVYEETFSPRKRLTASPYSFNSDATDGFHATSTATPNQLLALDNTAGLTLNAVTTTGGLNVGGTSTLATTTIGSADTNFNFGVWDAQTSSSTTSSIPYLRFDSPDFASILGSHVGAIGNQLIIANMGASEDASLLLANINSTGTGSDNTVIMKLDHTNNNLTFTGADQYIFNNNLTASSLVIPMGGTITLGGEARDTWPSGGGSSGGFWATSSLSNRVIHPDLTSPYAVIIGGTATTSDGSIFEVHGGSTVLGGSLIMGLNNSVPAPNAGAFTLGGSDNHVLSFNSDAAGIIGGIHNTVGTNGGLIVTKNGFNYVSGGDIFGAGGSTSTMGTVFGGYGNQSIGTGYNSVVVGGANNISSSTNGGIFTGEENVVTGWRAVVVGGYQNQAIGFAAGTYSGTGNIADGGGSSILGGNNNRTTASSSNSIVLGGFNSTVSGWSSSVLAGDNNLVSGDNSVALDGSHNTITGNFSDILGGSYNFVSGVNSYAIGQNMTVSGGQSIGIGLFGLGNSTSSNTVVDQNHVMAIMGGKVGIGTTSPAVDFSVAGKGYFTGGLGVGVVNNNAGTLSVAGNADIGGDINITSGHYINYNGLRFAYGSTTLGNHFFGGGAGNLNITGIYNTGLGGYALEKNTSGARNTGSGFASLGNNTIGNSNTGSGYATLNFNTTGADNTAFGAFGLYANTSGNGNVALGSNAGYVNDGSAYNSVVDNNMVFIGYNASRDSSVATTVPLTNGIAIGYNAKVATSNAMVLGSAGTRVGIGTSSPITALTVAGDGYFTGGLGVGVVNNTAGTLSVSGNSLLGGNLTVSGTTLSASNLTTLSLADSASNPTITIGNSTANSSLLSKNWNINSTGQASLGVYTASPNSMLTIKGTSTNSLLNVLTPASASALFVSSAGYVGIGTGVPSARLTVLGDNDSPVTGSDLVTNGSFTGNASGWTLGSFAYDANNITRANNADVSPLTQNITISTGKSYLITVDFIGYHARGSLTPSLGGVTGIAISKGFNGHSSNNTTTFSQIITTANTSGLSLIPSTDFAETIDNVSVKEITKSNPIATFGTEFEIRQLSSNYSMGLGAGKYNTAGSYNNALGSGALQNNVYGSYNIANGYQALFSNVTGGSNIANGYQALNHNIAGDNNIANGFRALVNNTTGENNIASGYVALENNIAGGDNVGLGYYALHNNTTGGDNIAIGNSVLLSNTIGSFNIGLGSRALSSNTTGQHNIAGGYWALNNNTTGNQNIALGYLALHSNTTADDNIGLGYLALGSNTIGDQNTALGNASLFSNSTGSGNVALGHQNLMSNTTGNNNMANGYRSLWANTTGSGNIAMGYRALYTSVSSSYNIALGYQSGNTNTTGNRLLFLGSNANILAPNSPSMARATGTPISSSGTFYYRVSFVLTINGQSIESNLSDLSSYITVLQSDVNRAVQLSNINVYSGPYNCTARKIYRTKSGGGATVYLVTTINDNTTTTYLDQTPDSSLTTLPNSDPSDSVMVGYGSTALKANQLVVGSSNSYISEGYFGSGVYDTAPKSFTLNSTGGSGTNIAGSDLIMSPGFGTGTGLGGNFIIKTAPASGTSGTLGNAAVERLRVTSAGYVGIGTSTPAFPFQVYVSSTVEGHVNPATGAWANTSDANLKTNVSTINDALSKIMGLNPVHYDWLNDPVSSGQVGRHTGFIAQQVEQILPELVDTDSSGRKSLSYALFTPLLAGAIQDQQTQINQLKSLVGTSSNHPVTTVTSLNVASSDSSNLFDSLEVTESATFYGTISVIGEAGFESKVTFKKEVEFQDHISVDADTAGTAIIATGTTSTLITFAKPYQSVPKVVANLQASTTPIFAQSVIVDKTVSGFRIVLNQPASTDLAFDWIALSMRQTDNEVSYTEDSSTPPFADFFSDSSNSSDSPAFVATSSTPETTTSTSGIVATDNSTTPSVN